MEDSTEQTEQTREDDINLWAYKHPSERVALIKERAKSMPNFNLSQLLTGHILELIKDDDIQVFGTALLFFNPKHERLDYARTQYLVALRRFEWELEQPELPENIRKMILPVKKQISKIRFTSPENVKTARKIWEENVFIPVKALINTNQDGMGSAIEAYRIFSTEVRRQNMSL